MGLWKYLVSRLYRESEFEKYLVEIDGNIIELGCPIRLVPKAWCCSGQSRIDELIARCEKSLGV